MGYQLILADPAWHYDNTPPRSHAAGHYEVLRPHQILGMPIAKLAARDSVLYLWCTMPQLPIGLQVLDIWGFAFRSVGFTWVKTGTTEKARKTLRNRLLAHGEWSRHLLKTIEEAAEPVMRATWAFGQGSHTRANAEVVLLGVRGSGPERMWKGCPSLVVAPRRAHSQKPDEVQERLERLYGDVSRLELFARRKRSGWDAWGDDLPGGSDVQIEVPPPNDPVAQRSQTV